MNFKTKIDPVMRKNLSTLKYDSTLPIVNFMKFKSNTSDGNLASKLQYAVSVKYTPGFKYIVQKKVCFCFMFSFQSVCAQSLSCVWLLATLWTVARQAPPPMESSR